MDENNFGVVGLADQIIHQVGGRLLQQMVVELVVGETLAVFAVDVHDYANVRCSTMPELEISSRATSLR